MSRGPTSSGNTLAYGSAILTAYPVSMACWFKVADITNLHVLMCIFKSASGGSELKLSAQGNAAGDPVAAGAQPDSGSGGAAQSTAGYSANVWQHGAAVFTSATDRAAYLNGGNKGTASTSKTIAGFNRTQFGSKGVDSQYCNGLLAEGAIWNVAITDDDVAMLALGYSPLLVKPESIVAYWPVVGIFSPEIDLVGGAPLTVSGTVAKGDHPRVFYPG